MSGKNQSEKKIEIGGRIRALRSKLQLSMEEFAQLIESTSATVSNIENGYTMPGGETLIRISQRLNVTADWVLFGASEQVQESESKLIFFHEKWHFFCRYQARYMTAAEQTRLQRLFVALEHIQHFDNDDLEMLNALLERMGKSPGSI
jgi:transcriptional regulator with XRE-family HTH domain